MYDVHTCIASQLMHHKIVDYVCNVYDLYDMKQKCLAVFSIKSMDDQKSTSQLIGSMVNHNMMVIFTYYIE